MVTKKLSLSLRCAAKQEFHEQVEPAEHEVSMESEAQARVYTFGVIVGRFPPNSFRFDFPRSKRSESLCFQKEV